MSDKDEAILKYCGPATTEGYMEASKFGQAIVGINEAFIEISRYHKNTIEGSPELKIKVAPGSIEIWLAVGVVGHTLGITEFSKQFCGEIGKQLALRLFARNGELKKEGQPTTDGKKLIYKLKNANGEIKEFDSDTLEIFNKKLLDKDLSDFLLPLQESAVDKLVYSYAGESVTISYNEKEYFTFKEDYSPEDNEEDFDDTKAEPVIALRGQFVTYKALASKYPFQFQAREQQTLYGKKFILCTLANENLRAACLDLMKSKAENILIKGLGIKNSFGQFSKIKVVSVEKASDGNLFQIDA